MYTGYIHTVTITIQYDLQAPAHQQKHGLEQGKTETKEGREGGNKQHVLLTDHNQCGEMIQDTAHSYAWQLALLPKTQWPTIKTQSNKHGKLTQMSVRHFQETTVIKHIWTRSVPGNYCTQTHLFQKTTIITHLDQTCSETRASLSTPLCMGLVTHKTKRKHARWRCLKLLKGQLALLLLLVSIWKLLKETNIKFQSVSWNQRFKFSLHIHHQYNSRYVHMAMSPIAVQKK